MQIKFSVPFVKSKARPRVVNGHAYTPRETRIAEKEVTTAYIERCLQIYGSTQIAPERAPVRVEISTRRPLPKSVPKRKAFDDDVVKPDIDNIAKLVLDALNGIAWHDDAQVVELAVTKTVRLRDVQEKTDISISWV